MGTSDTFTSMHFDLFLFCMNNSSEQPLCWVQEYSIAFVPFTPFNKDSFHATATDAFAIELHQQPVSHMLRELQQSAPSLSLSLSPAGINCLSRKLTLFPHRPNSTVPPHIAPIASAYVVVSSKRASIHLASGAYALAVCFSITIALTHSISLTRPMSVCVCVCLRHAFMPSALLHNKRRRLLCFGHAGCRHFTNAATGPVCLSVRCKQHHFSGISCDAAVASYSRLKNTKIYKKKIRNKIIFG